MIGLEQTKKKRNSKGKMVKAKFSLENAVDNDASGEDVRLSRKTGDKEKADPKLKCKGRDGCCESNPGSYLMKCNGCKQRYHSQCQGLVADAVAAILEFDLLWLCVRCKPSLMAILGAGRHLESRISEAESNIMNALNEVRPAIDLRNQIENKMKTMEKSLTELAEQQSKVESSIREQEVVQEMPKFSNDPRRSADQRKQFMLSRDKDERDKNLILHNIPN